MSTTKSIPARLRRILPAALFATATAGLVTWAPIAAAEWDIELYDDCMNGNWGSITYCCELSGGWMDWGPAVPTCRAPAPEAQGEPPAPAKPGLPTVTVQPPTVTSPPTTAVLPPVRIGTRA